VPRSCYAGVVEVERKEQVLAEIAVGCGQITWNQFRRQDEHAWPEERVLAQVAEAGYEGAPAGPRADRTAQETTALYARHGLRPAPGYLSATFWQADQQPAILEQARRYAAFARAAGCSELYVAAGGDYVTRRGLTRRQVAGHVAPEDALTDEENACFAATLNAVGAATLQEGVRACFHNHVGTVIETRAEIERLLALTDPTLVFLGPDTGHLAWGGADAVAFCRDYADRILTLHLKDIDAQVAARGRAEGWDYATFTRHGLFIELGEGCVDFPALVVLLRERDFAGWLIVETDVTQKPTALESAQISRRYLHGLGL
jgi:inosose dehydratase